MKPVLLISFIFFTFSVKAQSDTTVSAVDSAIYTHPEIPASYPGGAPYWGRYLSRNLRYPDKAVGLNIQGTVVVQFMVDTNGAAHQVVAISGPEALRDETVRVIKNVDIWIPATNQGKKVNSWKKQPVTFKLENY